MVRPRWGTSSQNWPKDYPTCDVTQKKTKPNTKKIFSLQTQILDESFEGLNSSLAQSSAEIHLCKNTCKLLDFIVSLPEQKVSTDNSSSNRSKFSSTSRANLSNCACICCVCTFISSCNDKEYHKNILLVSCSCSNRSSCKSVKTTNKCSW